MKMSAVIEKKKQNYDETPRSKKPLEDDKPEEPIIKRDPDLINSVIGSTVYFVRYNHPTWFDKKSGEEIEVDRYYPHKKIVVDFPRSKEEVEVKKRFFKEKGIKFICVAPGESMTVDDFKTRLTGKGK